MEVIDLRDHPELREIAAHVREARQTVVVRDEAGEDVVTIAPVRPRRGRTRRGKPLTQEDGLINIVSLGRSGRSDVATNKHEHLADAYRSEHE